MIRPSRIAELLDRIADARIAVVGDAMLDRYFYGTTERVSREAPVPIVIYDREEHRLGGAGNAARNVVALGGRATIASVAGQDRSGQALLRALRAAGIDPSPVVRERGRRTLTKLRVLAGAVGTGKQQVLRVDWQPSDQPRVETRRRFQTALRRALARADGVLVSDYGGGTIDRGAIKLLARAAQRIPVVVDSRYQLDRFVGRFVLKPNAPELATATGLPTDRDAEVALAARRLVERNGAAAVLTTRGRGGMTWVGDGREVSHQPIHGSDDVSDVTGAGDTVGAALALALACGAPAADAMALATVAAAIVVQKLGAATASPDEVRAALGLGSAR
ncbi:MAG: bifunctional hydroxymethylpyrimidine kinase/phosphomethylpyrimidine kinase [Deltaproteobacteria bacterium]|nr:bifunctional hydroxymethylpyrimidine kinase/phosphomethylpyrimidine kinase [Deltaproteobacteria bacterium]